MNLHGPNQVALMILIAALIAIWAFYSLNGMNESAYIFSSLLFGVSSLLVFEAGYMVVRNKAYEGAFVVLLGGGGIAVFIMLVAVAAFRMNRM